MPRSFTSIFIAAAVSLFLAGGAHAVAADDCKEGIEDETAVTACTAFVESGSHKGSELAAGYLYRASGYDNLGKYDDAMADLNKAIEIDAKFYPGYLGRAYLKMKLHQEEEALADFNSAIALKPDIAEPYAMRARHYFEAKLDFKGAVADYEKALKLDPDNQEIAAYLENAKYEAAKQK